eukprot:COSAG02_NODE_4364_length_5447_cov_19.656694_3_plen_172_part_00
MSSRTRAGARCLEKTANPLVATAKHASVRTLRIFGSHASSCQFRSINDARIDAGFSNGCAVGCDTCDGNSRGPIPSSYKTKTVPPTGVGRNKVGPNGVVCKSSNGVKPTICDPELRTVNQNATCGGEDDWYYFSPWRARTAAQHKNPHALSPDVARLTCVVCADVQRELRQ